MKFTDILSATLPGVRPIVTRRIGSVLSHNEGYMNTLLQVCFLMKIYSLLHVKSFDPLLLLFHFHLLAGR